MPVGQVAGPVTPVVQHLPQDHVGGRASAVVKNRVDPPLGHTAKLAHAGIRPGSILRTAEAAGKALLILGALDQNFRPGLRGNGNLHAAGGMDAPRAPGKDVPPGSGGTPGLPGEGNPAAEEEHGNFLPRPAECPDLPRLHLVDPHVHPHGGIVAVVGGENHLAGGIEFGITEYLAHHHAPFSGFK